MLLFYIDEFGDSHMERHRKVPGGTWHLKDGSSDWFILSAVGIPENSRLDLANAILNVKTKYFPGHEAEEWKHSELKGSFLRKAGDRLASGRSPMTPTAYASLTKGQYGALCTDLGRLWQRFRPLVYLVAIDKTTLVQREARRRYHPVGLSYTFLQQRLSILVERVHGRSAVLLIADEQTAHEKYFRSGSLHHVRKQITDRGGWTRR
jgi:hypothetical protein